MKRAVLRAVSLFTVISVLLASSWALMPAAGLSLFEHHIDQSFEERKSFDNYGRSDQSTSRYENMRPYLLEQFAACNSRIPIGDYNVPFSDFDAFSDFISDEFPEMFHVGRLTYTHNTVNIIYINVTYIYTQAQYRALQAQIDDVVAWLTRGLSSASDLEKILLVHDRLAVWAEYDYVNYLNDSIPQESFTMAGILLKGVGVCQGYAEAFLYIMRQLGIPCRVTSSKTMGHAWNIVTLNGKEYHVDVTWDDPSQNNYGQVYHLNFLRSSSGINSAHERLDTDFDRTPTDTTYDNYYWQNSISEFQLINGDFYYVDGVNENISRRRGTTSTVISSLSGCDWRYYISPSLNHTIYSFCYLSYDEDRLFVSTPESICSVNLSSGALTPVYSPALTNGNKIFGFKAYDGNFYMEFLTRPSNLNFDESCRYVYPYVHSFTLTYNANGGTGAPASQSAREGGSFTVSGVQPSKTGCDFIGWASSAYAVNAEYYSGSSIAASSDKTIYAVWAPKRYCVSFNANGGTCTAQAVYVLFGSTYGELPSASRENYSFIGWYTAKEGGSIITSSSSLSVSSDHTLYAHWKGLPLTITLKCGGGNLSQTVISTSCGELKGSDLPRPTRDGYVFTGWLLDGRLVANSSVIEASGQLELTARWVEKPSVNIVNYVSSRSGEDYRSSFLFTAEYSNLPDGCTVRWYDGKTLLASGDTCKVVEARSSFTVTAVIEDADGNEYARSGVENVTIKTGLWQMIIAFFRNLFGKLPYIVQ